MIVENTASGPVVVAIMSHRDPVILNRLIGRVLEGENTHVVVHHDPSGDAHEIEPNRRVHVLTDAAPAQWARPSQADAIMRTIRGAIREVPDLSWLLLVSGQDYPARHMRTIEAELASSSYDAMLRCFEVPVSPGANEHHWQIRCRARYLARRRLPGSHRSAPMPRRHPFRDSGPRLFIADTWVNLNARAVRRVLDHARTMAPVTRYLRTTANSDEALVPTLLLNDADDLSILNDRRRYIRWENEDPHPAELTLADAEPIAGSDAFFARKVDMDTQPLMDRLDELAAPDR